MRALLALFLSLAGCTSGAASSSAAASSARVARSAEVRYLALGDSFTIGTGSSPEQAFPARIAARLREGGAKVALENLGVNGFTTEDLEEVELPHLREFGPTLVTLAIGANDLVRGRDAEAYRVNVRRILGAIGASVSASRIVCLPQPDWARSPAARDFGDPDRLEKAIDRFNAVLRDEATRAGARYLDLAPLFRDEARKNLFASDGLHPSAAAHDAWAAAIAPELPR